MKILRLEVLNLASLASANGQPQVVDFSVEPLLSAGLSAITGPTGAGKSTLLDALCLALFDEVPRLRTANTGQEGKLPDVGQSLSFGDKRNLLSRGSGYGLAAVEFLGVDGQRYRAVWEVQRARKRLDGAMQKVNRHLKNLSTNQVLATQKTECAALIPDIIGMNFEQFTRAVLLAQTEFGAFLKATDQERAQLLECLTDTGIYSRLGVLAFAQFKQAKEQFERLQAEHGFVQALSADERAALDQQVAEQLAHKHTQRSQIDAYQQAEQWLGQYQRYQTELAQLHQAEQDWQQQWLACADQRQAVLDYQTTAAYRRDHAQRVQLEHQQQQQLSHIVALQQQHQQALQHVEDAQQRLEQQQQHSATLKQQHQQEWSWLALAKPIALELQRLRQLYTDHHHTLKALHAEQQPKIQQQQDYQQQLQHIQAQLTDLQQQLQAYADWANVPQTRSDVLKQQGALWQAAQQHLQQFEQQQQHKQHAWQLAQQQQQHAERALTQQQQQYGDLATQHAQCVLLDQQLHHTKQQFEDAQQHLSVAQQRQQLQTQQQDHQRQLEQLTTQREHAAAAHQQQQQVLAAVEQLYRQQQQRHDEWVVNLRHHLRPDQACPVCGSLEHPFTQHPDALAQQLFADSQQHYQQQHTQLQTCWDAYQQLDQQYQLAQQQHAWLTTQQTQLAQRYPDYHRQACSVQQIEQQITALHHALDRLQQQRSQQQQRLEQTQQLERHAQQARDQALALAEQVTHQQQHAAQLEQHHTELTQFLLHLLPNAQQHSWQQATCTARAALIDTWVHALSEREQLQQRLQAQQQQQQQLLQQHERLSHELQYLAAKIEEYKRLLEQQTIEGQSAKLKLDKYLGFARPVVESTERWEAQLNAQQQQQQQQQQQAEQHYHQADKALHGIHSALTQQQQHQHALQHSINQLEQQMADWRQQHPQFDADKLAQLDAWTPADYQQQQQQIQQLQQQLLNSQAQTAQLQRQYTTWQQTRPAILTDDLDLPQIQHHLQQLQAQLADTEQQWATLYGQQTEDDRKQQQALALQQAMGDAQQQYHRWAKIVEPIGCSTGAKFRKIAQSYQLDVLLQYANQQLKLLSPRYRLQRAHESLGLLVVDQEMANEQRSVHSLSGGESFLMSLALALGLAQMASGQVKIESLFIDEGFGTLDPESLQLVMDALDQLQSQGRKVIVITHVQEMQERIPTQIQVQRLGAGRSHIVITPSLQKESIS